MKVFWEEHNMAIILEQNMPWRFIASSRNWWIKTGVKSTRLLNNEGNQAFWLVSQIRETIERAFSKITPQWSLYPLLFPHLWGTETFLTLKEGSTFLTKPLFNSLYDPFGSPYRGQKPSGTRGCNRPTVLNFLPLRSKVGGPKRSSPYFARWDRRGWDVYNLQFIINSLLFRVNSLQLIFGGFCWFIVNFLVF